LALVALRTNKGDRKHERRREDYDWSLAI